MLKCRKCEIRLWYKQPITERRNRENFKPFYADTKRRDCCEAGELIAFEIETVFASNFCCCYRNCFGLWSRQ